MISVQAGICFQKCWCVSMFVQCTPYGVVRISLPWILQLVRWLLQWTKVLSTSPHITRILQRSHYIRQLVATASFMLRLLVSGYVAQLLFLDRPSSIWAGHKRRDYVTYIELLPSSSHEVSLYQLGCHGGHMTFPVNHHPVCCEYQICDVPSLRPKPLFFSAQIWDQPRYDIQYFDWFYKKLFCRSNSLFTKSSEYLRVCIW